MTAILGNYYELPKRNPEVERLDLEKLERLRGVLVLEELEIKPPQKNVEEIKSLLQKLRDGVKSEAATEIRPSVTPQKLQKSDAKSLTEKLRELRDESSRTLLLLADLALLPISPSILDVWSVQQATGILRYAQQINGGRPEGRLVLNKMRTRDTISRELRTAAPELGVGVATTVIRDLQAYRDAAQQGTTVTRMGRRSAQASEEIVRLFSELLPDAAQKMADKEAANG